MFENFIWVNTYIYFVYSKIEIQEYFEFTITIKIYKHFGLNNSMFFGY
jgi:hypothetical protein